MKPPVFLITAAIAIVAGFSAGRYWAATRSRIVPAVESSGGEVRRDDGKAGGQDSGARDIRRVERLLLTGNSEELHDDPAFVRLLVTQPDLVAAALGRIPQSWREHADGTGRAEIYQRVFRSWAAKDAPAALRSAESVPVNREKLAALQGVVEGARSGNPGIALAALAACVVDDDPARETALQLAGEEKAIRANFSLCRLLPASPGRNRVLKELLSAAREADPEAASDLWSEVTDAEKEDLARSGFMPRENPAADHSVAGAGPGASPEFPGALAAGRAAVEKCPPPERTELLFYFFNGAGAEWSRQEPEDVYAWLERTVTPHQLMGVLHHFGRAAAALHPDILVKIAASQPSPARTSLLAGALLDGCPDDFRPEADAFVATLPEEMQHLIRRTSGR